MSSKPPPPKKATFAIGAYANKMDSRPKPTGKVNFYKPPQFGQTAAMLGRQGWTAATAATHEQKEGNGKKPMCIQDGRVIMGAGQSQQDADLKMAELMDTISKDMNDDDDDDETVLRPCDNCNALVWWNTGGHAKPVCKQCKRVQGGEDAEIDYHAGYEGENPVQMQGGAVNDVMMNGNPHELKIGKMYGPMAKTQQYVHKIPYGRRKLVAYGILISDTLSEMRLTIDPVHIRAAVLHAYKMFNNKKSKRMLKKSEVHILARELHNALVASKVVGQIPFSQAKLAEVMQRKFDETMQETHAIMEPRMTFASAAKLQQLAISTDSKLKTQSNMSSALALIKESKAYVKESFPDSFDDSRIDAIAKTFIEMKDALSATFQRATMLTIGPAMLTIAKRRHGVVAIEDELETIKATSRKHISPMLANGIHIPHAEGSSVCETPTLLEYIKTKSRADADALDAALRAFESAVALIVSPLQQYMAILHVEKTAPNTDMSEYKSILEADDLEGLEESANLIVDLTRAAHGNPSCYRASWSRMVDPVLMDSVRGTVSKSQVHRSLADAVSRSLAVRWMHSARLVDLAAILCCMEQSLRLSRTQAAGIVAADFGLSEPQIKAVAKLAQAMAHKIKADQDLLNIKDTENKKNNNDRHSSSSSRKSSKAASAKSASGSTSSANSRRTRN